MNEKSKDKKIKRLFVLLLVLLIVVLSVFNAPETGAVEKTLSVDTGHYVRWRKGLPPEDGKWYRLLLVSTTWGDRFLQGNTIIDSVDGNKDGYLSLQNDIGKFDKYFPDFDLTRDVNYTQHYYNTPFVRFAKYDNKNNHDKAAPMYYIRLADWTGEDGNRTELGPVPGDTAGRSTRDIYFIEDPEVPWAFVTSAHDDDVDEGRVVLEQFRQGGVGQSWHFSIAPTWDGYVGTGELNMWMVSQENILYYGDEITIDTIADGQIIEDDEIVNISGSNYLTLAMGYTLTVKDGGILSIGSGLYNDGTIRVEKGGTLIIQQDAFLMPMNTDSGTGNVICDGGDVIVYSGGKLVCEGVSGFKMTDANNNYGTVYNYGLIMATNLTLKGKARSVHNEGSIVVGWVVEPQYAQAFRDKKINPKGTDISTVHGLKTKGHITYDVGSGVITGYTSPLVY